LSASLLLSATDGTQMCVRLPYASCCAAVFKLASKLTVSITRIMEGHSNQVQT
jgi:hypothetical protein